ncbi:ATP-grasp domain-containing protein [Macrococcus hajekii]|uniref:ATP-grasp domain-containing protein n=1 Tax=Macrococcus hajekii TaxID=198482 RepID=A0A4R6BHR4_9STAP|nr:ATP-grasp domain-containing protein [Macrococcus hajekii]TDM01130.1 ATP-grasp domain-containing protein [Macrococcus hajekii]GGB12220.1 ATP-grasp domain-containing protein [Macrococcus hajekii]
MNNFLSKRPLTMHQLYGDHVVFTSRPSFEKNPWLTTEEHQANMLTARELLIADMPVIIHEAAVGEKPRELMRAAGVDFPSHYRTFKDAESYNARLREAEKNGEKIFFQYAHSSEFVDPSTYYIDKELFVALNNKMKLSDWTKGKFLPKREVVAVDELEETLKKWNYPYVIKPGDEHPTAGGYGVMICYNDEDRKQALNRIKEAETDSDFVIEDYINTKQNYCVQYAYSENTGLNYIGASIQNTNEYGKYFGNITAHNVPQTVIEAGREIMQNGVDAGYKGIAGFDLLVDDKGEVYAIDLNFRQNGSTSMLIMDELLAGDYEKFFGAYAKVSNDAFYERILDEVKAGRLFPLAYYDGDFYEDEHVPSRFVGIWHGEQQDVDAHDKAFAEFNQ